MSSKKKVVAVAITTLALTVGGVGVGNADTIVKKITKKTVTTKRVTGSDSSGITNPMEMGKGPEAQIASVLSGLVTKGTITQAQADAITAAFVAEHAARDASRPLPADRAALDALVASTLGIDAATIKSRLQAGETLAAIAGSKKGALIDALVAEETKRIDARVSAGTLTTAKATTLKAGLVAHITAEVDSVHPKGKPMGGGKKGKGPKGGQHDAPMGPAPTIPSTGSAA